MLIPTFLLFAAAEDDDFAPLDDADELDGVEVPHAARETAKIAKSAIAMSFFMKTSPFILLGKINFHKCFC